MQPEPSKLGLIAGNGRLPQLMLEAARGQGRDVFIVALKGHAAPELTNNHAHKWIRLGDAGEGIAALREAGCTDIVMCGGVRRPSLSELRPDWYALKFLSRIGTAVFGGDDTLLRAVREQLTGEGFNLLAPDDLMQSLLTTAGVLGTHKPDEQAESDITRGRVILNALAPHDVGQAVVVQEGLVLGIEAIEGTAALITRTSQLRREGKGAVLIKLSKPQQHRKLDLPTIGPDTVHQCQAAGIRGIAIEAGRSLLIDRDEVIRAADAAGIFVVGIGNAS